jgi:hypothetical protein
MKSETISLGGKHYEINELPRRANAQWRQQFQVLIASVTNLVEASQVDITNTTDLVAVVGQVRDVLMQAPDQLIELLFAYSPALAADRERIEAEVYESEILSVFVEVLKLAFPFGEILSWASGLASAASATTSTS